MLYVPKRGSQTYGNSGKEPQKGNTGTVDSGFGTVKGGWETGNRSLETGYRGRETRSRAVRQRTGYKEQGRKTGDSGQ